MADFLASYYDPCAENTATVNNDRLSSVEDLAAQLQNLVHQKTTETRAEHMACTFELRNTARFTLSLNESENRELEGLGNVDPLLAGGEAHATRPPADPAGSQTTRVIAANDALVSQPENPVLQLAIAKHIIAAVSTTDGSGWVLRDLSRRPHGWTATYICKDSIQQWNRQNAKKPAKAIIGEYSFRSPDPVLTSRIPP